MPKRQHRGRQTATKMTPADGPDEGEPTWEIGEQVQWGQGVSVELVPHLNGLRCGLGKVRTIWKNSGRGGEQGQRRSFPIYDGNRRWCCCWARRVIPVGEERV